MYVDYPKKEHLLSVYICDHVPTVGVKVIDLVSVKKKNQFNAVVSTILIWFNNWTIVNKVGVCHKDHHKLYLLSTH